MAYFLYRQNNSGGDYDIDLKKGLNINVIVEADSEMEADAKACDVGIYFDGVANGTDCECCGDRWYGSEEITNEELLGYSDSDGVSIHRKTVNA
jgi:hypothetical protein